MSKGMVTTGAGSCDLSDLELIHDTMRGLGAKGIATFGARVLQHEQVPCPVVHHFSPGLYVRELSVQAGAFLVGYRQKTEHLNVFLKGKVSIVNEQGEISTKTAPMIFTSPPGRKVGYVVEDMVWLNVYPTMETDIKKLEETYLDKTDIWAAEDSPLPKYIDNENYKSFLSEYGLTDEIVRGQAENDEDIIPFPSGSYSVAVFASPIEGMGLFATARFEVGEVIAPGAIDGMRTPAGRYINHAKRPNAKMVRSGSGVVFVAIKNIEGNLGGKLGDEITTDYRHSLIIKEGEALCREQ